jgi:predicted NBD/HSP70 family sugar kinase
VAEAHEPVSRAQIAATTGLTRATASALVEVLLAGDLVHEIVLPPTERSGRPAVGLALAPGGPGGLGLEINVDYVAATVVDLTGAVVVHEVRPGDQRLLTPAQALRKAAGVGAAALAAAQRRGVQVAGAAVAVPGLVRDGRLLRAPNLGWQDVDVHGLLTRDRRLAAVPLALDNEANYAALSEVSASARTFVHVSGEIGIGAGIVLDGELYRGSRGWSGEIGHVTVDASGPECHCGATGCLEVYAGLEAILRAAGLAGDGLAGNDPGPVVGGQGVALAERAARGDRASLAALDAAAGALGTVLAGVLNILDISTVVLGGSYAPLAPWLLPTVGHELARRVLWSAWEPPSVRTAAHGPEAAALGAARSVVSSVLAEPERWLVT